MSNRQEIIGTAPYNFVPLPERIINRYESLEDLPSYDARKKEDRNLLSGEITFNIIAKNPILVADEQKENAPREFVKNAEGTYEIPGSSLRGLLRNTMSVLSLSDWTEQIEDERFFYRSVAESSSDNGKHYKTVLGTKQEIVNNKRESVPQNVKAGFIVKTKEGEYCIYPAKSDEGRHGRTYYKVNDGNMATRRDEFRRKVKNGFIVEAVTFSLTSNGKVVKLFQKDASFKGHLLYSGFIKTGRTQKVSAYLINEIDKEKKPIKLDLEDVKAYKADLKFRISKFPNTERERMENFFKLPEQPGFDHAKPCFYINYDGVTYFGFTAFLRLLYPYSTKDLLPEYITNKKQGIDYAASLFGFIDSKNNVKYASRIHFHNATLKNKVEPLDPVRVMSGSPRASAYRFYLKQDGKDSSNPNTYLTKDTTIRGMKQYWIKDEDIPNVDQRNERTLSELKFLPKHTTFQAIITFDQLHEDELGLFLWALTGPQYHQLGMGKPYGYGVVTFENVKCVVTNNENMYKDLTNFFEIGEEPINIDSYIHKYKTYMKELLKASGFHVDDQFKLEDLESIQTFLAMKEKAKLEKRDMRYTDHKNYSKVILPSAKELLNMDKKEIEKVYREKVIKGTNQAPVKKANRNRRKQQRSRKNHQNQNRTLTYNPFADVLKDFHPKN